MGLTGTTLLRANRGFVKGSQGASGDDAEGRVHLGPCPRKSISKRGP